MSLTLAALTASRTHALTRRGAARRAPAGGRTDGERLETPSDP